MPDSEWKPTWVCDRCGWEAERSQAPSQCGRCRTLTATWTRLLPFPYEECTDPDCPVAYAYRAPFPEVPHYHHIGNTERPGSH